MGRGINGSHVGLSGSLTRNEYGFGTGSYGLLRSFILASPGVRSAFRWLQGLQALTTLSHVNFPPLHRG